MFSDNNIVERLKDKLKTVNDVELVYLVNKLIAEREDLLENINIDQLTGVYNRRILNYINEFSVIVMCDIDDFKKINDSYGHDVGDLALKILAKELYSNIRINDVVCRYGGDEFLIIFNDCNKEVVCERMRKVQEDLKYPFRDKKYEVSISVGIAERENDQSLTEVITNADMALYNSKNNGKNRISLYSNKELVLKLK